MAKITITDDQGRPSVNVDISADWLSCLIPALLAGLPGFLDAFMKCISNGGTSGDFKPGNRPRCG